MTDFMMTIPWWVMATLKFALFMSVFGLAGLGLCFLFFVIRMERP